MSNGTETSINQYSPECVKFTPELQTVGAFEESERQGGLTPLQLLTHITEVGTIETWVHRILEFGCVNNISARGLDVATAYSNCVERKLSLNCSVLRGFLTQNNPTAGLPENGE